MLNYIKNLYKGRIGRKNWIFGVLLFTIVYYILGSVLEESNSTFANILLFILFIVYFIYYTAIFTRRFHDLGDTGWKIILGLVPLLNIIILFYLLFTKGKNEPNKYGEAPLENVKFFDDILNRKQDFLNVKIENKSYCGNCGKQIDRDSKFCFNCGTKVINFNE